MIERSGRILLRSLRWRVVVGLMLWSMGLLVFLNHVLWPFLVRVMPSIRGPRASVLFSLGGTLLLLAGLLIVGGGLRKLDGVRASVLALRAGKELRLEGVDLPEIEPLVRDMNQLLDERERDVRRARATAGDLAHGLKTPLALVAQETERLERAGQHEIAATIAEQVERMRRQVDWHLARARASASGASTTYGATIELGPVVDRLARTMRRLFANKNLELTVSVDAPCAVRCETEDLEEMLGNVLDNACKWALFAVEVTASPADGVVRIVVSDDGPGLDAASRERVLQRGVRVDETEPGSGLGLAIVRELAELQGGALVLDEARTGGLRVELTLPAAPERS